MNFSIDDKTEEALPQVNDRIKSGIFKLDDLKYRFWSTSRHGCDLADE
jgi:hypothetical protein